MEISVKTVNTAEINEEKAGGCITLKKKCGLISELLVPSFDGISEAGLELAQAQTNFEEMACVCLAFSLMERIGGFVIGEHG